MRDAGARRRGRDRRRGRGRCVPGRPHAGSRGGDAGAVRRRGAGRADGQVDRRPDPRRRPRPAARHDRCPAGLLRCRSAARGQPGRGRARHGSRRPGGGAHRRRLAHVVHRRGARDPRRPRTPPRLLGDRRTGRRVGDPAPARRCPVGPPSAPWHLLADIVPRDPRGGRGRPRRLRGTPRRPRMGPDDRPGSGGPGDRPGGGLVAAAGAAVRSPAGVGADQPATAARPRPRLGRAHPRRCHRPARGHAHRGSGRRRLARRRRAPAGRRTPRGPLHRRCLPRVRRRSRRRPERALADGGGRRRRPATLRPAGLRRRGSMAGRGGRLHGRHQRRERDRADERPGPAARSDDDDGAHGAGAGGRHRRRQRGRGDALRRRRRLPADRAGQGDGRRHVHRDPAPVPGRLLAAGPHGRGPDPVRRTSGARRRPGPAARAVLLRRGRRHPDDPTRRIPMPRCRCSPPRT